MSAYSLVSFILNIKDRHNGNILIDKSGRVVHIDFGFLFDTQPGGYVGLEKMVPFKLTKEMLSILGEDIKNKSKQHSDPYIIFVDLMIRGYLACRDYMDLIFPVCEAMIQSELPCFREGCMKNFKARFCSDSSDNEATEFILQKLEASYLNIFSYFYDKYQELFENVKG